MRDLKCPLTGKTATHKGILSFRNATSGQREDNAFISRKLFQAYETFFSCFRSEIIDEQSAPVQLFLGRSV